MCPFRSPEVQHVQAPDAMRSLASALQLLTTALGSYVATAVTTIINSVRALPTLLVTASICAIRIFCHLRRTCIHAGVFAEAKAPSGYSSQRSSRHWAIPLMQESAPKIHLQVTTKNGSLGWLPDNLNSGRLDLYYAVLVVLSVLNIFFFIIVAKLYKYKKVGKPLSKQSPVRCKCRCYCMLESAAS